VEKDERVKGLLVEELLRKTLQHAYGVSGGVAGAEIGDGEKIGSFVETAMQTGGDVRQWRYSRTDGTVAVDEKRL
jgi:hypothetical protein